MSKLIDITGQDFGYWHVIEKLPYKKMKKQNICVNVWLVVRL